MPFPWSAATSRGSKPSCLQSEKSAKDRGFSGLDNEFYLLLDSFLEDVPSSSDNLNLMSIPSF